MTPWCLTVSFTHPHDPYVARRRYWDLYADCDDLMPHVPALDFADQDPHSQRLFLANDYKNFDISDEDVSGHAALILPISAIWMIKLAD